MLARQLAEPYPAVASDATALEAARLLAEQRLPGLIVVDPEGHPRAVLPGSQVLRYAIPRYVQDDPALARAYRETASDKLFAGLAGHRVQELVPASRHAELPVVDGDATAMEIAAVMAGMHSPVVAVVDGDEYVGAVTLAHLLAVLLPAS